MYDAVRVLATGGRTVVLRGGPPTPEAVGRLIPTPDRSEAFLVVEDLAPPPAGKTYQLWLVHDGERENGGLLTIDANGLDVVVVRPPRPLDNYRAISMTVEPVGGSASPTGPQVMGGPLP